MTAEIVELTQPKKAEKLEFSIPESGLDIVPRRKGARRGKTGSNAAWAKIDFKPWPKSDPPNMPGPSREFMDNIGIAARLGHATCQRSKQQLIDVWEDTPESIMELMDYLGWASEHLKSLAHMVEIATIRLMISGCANLQQKGEKPNVVGLTEYHKKIAPSRAGLWGGTSKNGSAGGELPVMPSDVAS